MMRLFIDSREPIDADDIPKTLRDIPDCVIEVKQLDIGDYLIEHNEERLCIERKTIADLVASITDGRHREQKARLIDVYGTGRILFIIEGDPFKQVFKSRITPYTVFSSLLNTLYRDNCRIIMTRSYSETLMLIQYTALKISKTGLVAEKGGDYTEAIHNQIKVRKRDNITPAFLLKNYLASVPGISMKLAEDIAGCLEIISIKDLTKLANENSRDEFIELLNNRYGELMLSAGEPRRSISVVAGRIYDSL